MIIVSAPVAPEEIPEPPIARVVEPRLGLALALIGTDGSTWDLTSGPVRLAAGPSGFGVPTPEHWWRTAPALDGSRWQGMRTPARELSLPVNVHGTSSLGWRDTVRDFFNALDPRSEAQLVAVAPDATIRTLDVRYVDGGDPVTDIDPMLMRYGGYPLDLIAADPFWKGPTVTSSFIVEAGGDFFPGPPFYLESAHAIGTATVSNPGPIDAWGVWTVDGPFTGFTVGANVDGVDKLITLTTTKVGGQSVTIDTFNRTILDDAGNDLWLAASEADFAAIPAGTDVELTLNVTGAGTGTAIDLSFDPRYWMAL